jgi:hypothetical protein
MEDNKQKEYEEKMSAHMNEFVSEFVNEYAKYHDKMMENIFFFIEKNDELFDDADQCCRFLLNYLSSFLANILLGNLRYVSEIANVEIAKHFFVLVQKKVVANIHEAFGLEKVVSRKGNKDLH